MDEIAKEMEDLMGSNPEWTFSELVAELVKKGKLEYPALEDPYIHAALHSRFSRAKAHALGGRINRDI